MSDEDSNFQSCSQRKKKPEYYEGLGVKDDDAVIPVNESFPDFDEVDGCGLSGSCSSQMPGDYSSQGYSSPLLMSDLCNGTPQDDIPRNRSGCRSDLEVDRDSVNVGNEVGKRVNDLHRGWPLGQLRCCGFCGGGRKDIPVDFGYSSGSHSNDETDNSAKRMFVWSRDRQSCCVDKESPNRISKAIRKENILNSVTGRCRNATDEKMVVRGLTCGHWCFEGEDGMSLPGTEDEMSAELPLDDIPVFVSFDFCAEDSGGDIPKRTPPLAKMVATCKKKLHFTEPLGTGDWPLTTANDLEEGRRGIGQLENDPKMPLAEKGNGERETIALSCSTSLSGSCYVSGEGNDRNVFGKLKSSVDEMKNISSEPDRHVLRCSAFLQCEDDVGVPICDSLNSSLATDDIQVILRCTPAST